MKGNTYNNVFMFDTKETDSRGSHDDVERFEGALEYEDLPF